MLGDEVKEQRELQGLTQGELASKAGLSRVIVGQIERGEAKPSIATMGKIANALNCDLYLSLEPKTNPS